ncbi:adenylosuccinate synthase [Halopelagius longus]|uniref:Adenylosuccinate synthetase n=1 Tax=Halopelagius longus TaxID=1236180 RepID=A0A1H1GVD7_9EURY|nr:adenylosuccinate synthase [Halopelagius longus]RDI69538.1 adenylosuccinate synthase [Halopelagius longus]SDR17164.1 Adenylosuccinate synthetase [Halopelagius longus]
MTITIVGSQLGDEGKGGAVDLFGESADIVVRYQGGDNAGHTVVVKDEKYKLSLLPSGVVRGKVGVIGNGCVVNPETLFEELDTLRERGLDPTVRIAERAHVIFPYHRMLDGIQEQDKDDLAVGTTGRGIGPTYEDKASRYGIRVGDLLTPETLRDRLKYVVSKKRVTVENFFDVEAGDEFNVDQLFETYRAYGERLKEEEMIVNCSDYLRRRINDGDEVMLEGAQGTLIDVDHGTYPYVTSSNPSAGAACTGSGLGPSVIGNGEIIGIVKSYTTRVGNGAMPTEIAGVEGQTPDYENGADITDTEEGLAKYIRDEGGEYGTVTGRPRRVGWLDMPMLRHAAHVNSFTGIVVGHVDVLAGLDKVEVGHSYQLKGNDTKTVPATTEDWDRCTVNYRIFDGWPEVDWSATADKGYEAIPENARTYLEYIQTELDTPIYAVGVGPAREDTIVLQDLG